MIGRRLCEVSCRISRCENRRVTEVTPVCARAANACCASEMEDTVVSPILMSQAPLIRKRHQEILAAGVLDVIPPRKSCPLMCARQRPTVRCLLRSKRRRSKTSSNASWYGSGDMYTNTMSFCPILNSETISEAVGGGASGVDQTRAAATAIGLGNTVSCNGRGVFRQKSGTHQRVGFNL